MIDKKLIVGLGLAGMLTITNICGYYNAKERINKYESVEMAEHFHKKDSLVRGNPLSEIIYQTLYGIGDKIAYSTYNNNIDKGK